MLYQRRMQMLTGTTLGLALSLVWALYLIALAVWIVLQKRPPLSTLAWLLALAALPLVGFVIYFYLGPQKIRRQRMRRQRLRALHRGGAQPDHALVAQLPEPARRLGALVRAITGAPVSSAQHVALLAGGAAAFEAILAAIAQAQRHVHLEYYIFEPDQIGTRIRDALIERARAGVQVRVLLDAVGSSRASRRFLAPLRDAGGDVAWFHPFRLATLRPLLNLRTHRKIVVVDGRIGFTGGINITDDEDARVSRHAFHDLHLRLEGAAVGWLQEVFAEDWLYARHAPLDEQDLYPAAMAGTVAVQVLASGPDGAWEAIHRAKLQAISDATTRVWLVTPYFVPGEAALFALTSAALRGVDVRVLVPRRSDSRIVTLAGRSYFDELLEAGVRIYQYQPRMLHSKALLVDDACVIIGTANFDQRSFRLNFEVAAAVYDPAAAALLEHQFESDFSHSQRVVRPRRLDPLRRLAEASARLLSPLL